MLRVDSCGFPSGSGNSGKPSRLFSAKSIHASHPGRIGGQFRGVFTLAHTEVVEAAGVGKCECRTAAAERRIHAIGFHHRGADQRRVAVYVIHGREEAEMVLVLDDPEREATPFQRARDGHHVGVDLLERHRAVFDRLELDVLRIGQRVPDELTVADLFEPAAERVVAAQIGVDGVVHRRDVALARHVTAGDDLPGEVQARGRSLTVVLQVLTLHVADRHCADRRAPRLVDRVRRRMPGDDRARLQRPFVKCANRYLADAHYLALPARPPRSGSTIQRGINIPNLRLPARRPKNPGPRHHPQTATTCNSIRRR